MRQHAQTAATRQLRWQPLTRVLFTGAGKAAASDTASQASTPRQPDAALKTPARVPFKGAKGSSAPPSGPVLARVSTTSGRAASVTARRRTG